MFVSWYKYSSKEKLPRAGKNSRLCNFFAESGVVEWEDHSLLSSYDEHNIPIFAQRGG